MAALAFCTILMAHVPAEKSHVAIETEPLGTFTLKAKAPPMMATTAMADSMIFAFFITKVLFNEGGRMNVRYDG